MMGHMALDKELCTRGLTTRIVGNVIHFHDEVTSTNDLARELAEGGAKEGTVVIANSQTGGKGRLDRTFSSPKGGIYLSVIFRPDESIEELSALPLVMGLSVSKAVQCTVFKEVKLKWPNDVLLDNRKISGILLTSSMKGRTVEYVIVGIGVNLNTEMSDLPEEISEIAGSLSGSCGKMLDPNEFTRDLIYFIDLNYMKFIDGDRELLLDQWSARSETIGSDVVVRTEKGEISGKALGVDQFGALILQTEEGMQRVDSGDCIIVN